MSIQVHCLCGSGIEYAQCCEPFHSGERSAPTAEALMRSRFTAFAMHNESYLLKTWDVSKRPADIDFSKDVAEWQRLEICNSKKGGVKDSKGLVEFKAFYLRDGKEHVMNEISHFRRRGRQWLYLDGAVKSIAKVGQQSNLGKNALCFCGSGKKFKRCCGAV